jgi:hypothetical protein
MYDNHCLSVIPSAIDGRTMRISLSWGITMILHTAVPIADTVSTRVVGALSERAKWVASNFIWILTPAIPETGGVGGLLEDRGDRFPNSVDASIGNTGLLACGDGRVIIVGGKIALRGLVQGR